MSTVKVSVITVCYNAAGVIKNTLLSVLKQDYKKLEYVVVDGGSTDGTLSVIRDTVQECRKEIKLISERDTGIYNAMNKGVKISTGDYVIFMNAGDVFSEPTIISKLVQKSFGYDVVYGNHYFIRKNKVKLIISAEISKITEDSIICHQASMTKRKLLIDSPFDESLTIAADYDFFLKQYINGMRFKYIKIGVVYYDVTGLSSNVFLTRKEHEKIRKKYGVISAKKEFINFMRWKAHDIFRLLIPRKIKDILYHQNANHWYLYI